MGKLAVLRIGDGSFDQGFPATLRIGVDGELPTLEIEGHLPPAPHLPNLLESWQFSYRSRGTLGSYRQLKVPDAQVTRQRSNLKLISGELTQAINHWLNSGDRALQKIRDHLLKTVSQSSEVRFVIQTDHLLLWRLPWQLWDLVQEHPHVEVALYPKELRTISTASSKTTSDRRVKILVLLGDSTNINIQTDLNILQQQLPNADIYVPTQIQREQISDQLWTETWDILFFAGHSSSQGEGQIFLDQHTSLTIADLKHALRRAIAHGLKLAIFNSCDGLKLAQDLADIQLPTTIVMRERIPDEAAQKFLHYFLTAFANQHKSLYTSLREARERLHSLEDKYPCVSWLPIVCQSPAHRPFNWLSLSTGLAENHPNQSISSSLSTPAHPVTVKQAPSPPSSPTGYKRPLKLKTRCLISLVVVGFVFGWRTIGGLEPLELWAYDRAMPLQRHQELDPRLLVVTVTDADVAKLGKPLPDQVVYRLLTTLERYQPRVIGLDIYRDIPIEPGNTALLQQLRQMQQVVAICDIGEPDRLPPVPHPPGVPPTQLGFADALMRDPDGIVRRYSLAMTKGDSACPTELSFGLQVAQHYLTDAALRDRLTPQGTFHISPPFIRILKSQAGGYQQSKNVGLGWQVLIPYQRSHQVAEEVSLNEILTKPESRFLRDRIVLIGYTSSNTRDRHPTPVGEMFGVRIHAHIINQVLKSTLSEPAFITCWSPILENVWISVWAILGGIAVGAKSSRRQFWVVQGIGLAVILSSSLYGFSCGIWIPVIPALIAYFSALYIGRYWFPIAVIFGKLRGNTRQSK